MAAHAQILLRDLSVRARSAEERLYRAIASSYASLIRENLKRRDVAVSARPVKESSRLFCGKDVNDAF